MTVRVVEYGRFTVAAGNVPPFDGPLLLTGRTNGAEANAPTVSVARMVKLTFVPTALVGGVPLNVLPVRLNHDGRPVADHVSEPVPPVPVNGTL